jgi:thiol-disulfide isomerase/thioredoxin
MKTEYILFIIIAAALGAGVFILAKPTHTQMSQAVATNNPEITPGEISEPIVKSTASKTTLIQKALVYQKYKEIADPAGFVNTNGAPITLSQYVGKKVILLDFVAYSCINCQRTFPYLNDWYSKYEDKGLVIIGIHTPEFAFEHEQKNVEEAMKQFGIKFPVVLDNTYGTWNAYGNQFWPRKYLIDIDGYVVYDHIGEGNYSETEAKIVDLLNERATRLNASKVNKDKTPMNETPAGTAGESPETYLGSARNQYEYIGTGSLPKDRYMLSGSWNKMPEYAELTSDTGTISYHFYATKLHFVAEAPSGDTAAEILLDGKPISAEDSGADVKNGVVTFNEARLYTLVDLKGKPGEHTIEIKIHKKGLQAYTFTFS